MGRNNQQRRAEKRRKDARRASHHAPPGRAGEGGHDHTHERRVPREQDLVPLVIEAAMSASGSRQDVRRFEIACGSLTAIELDPAAPSRPTAVIAALLDQHLDDLFEHGWQPADVAHAVKREWKVKAARLVIGAIAAAARRTNAPTRAPQPWLDQLADLGAFDVDRRVVVGGQDDHVVRWRRTERLHPDETITIGLQVLSFVLGAPKLSILVDPPSAWGASNRGIAAAPATNIGDVDAKALKVIRALLAKAEATTFDAEAEAFTVKAQELMTRHSIDAAVVASAAHSGDRTSGIESRRIHIDSPYADEKATFLSIIGNVNGVRSVWLQWAGFVTLMGFPIDLHLTDVLFTSLLVQATAASTEATTRDPRQRTPSFRRAFLISYAHRIGERLEATKMHAESDAQATYGSSLLPILADRAAAVEEAYDRAFPNATPMKRRSFDALGWHAGRTAAERAQIGAGEAIDRP
ncbi:MAG: DUF2786 domain-containing protein [Ilumatobacteraceae bacterium]